MLIFGHRGSSGTDPENTIRAFRQAIAVGADGVELDVHATADGVPVVIHDADVSRTTNGSGEVATMSLAELRQLDAGQGEQVPTLDEVVSLLAGKLTIDLEIKQPGVEALTLDVLARHPTADWFISSFDWGSLLEVRRLSPSAAVWPLADVADDALFEIAARLGSPGVALRHNSYDATSAARFSEAGLGVGVWTVNEPAEGGRVRELGAATLMTDYPEQMRKAIAT
jgi:glycerophosphoryl diester phosphodiesterase